MTNYLDLLWPINVSTYANFFFSASSFYPGRGDNSHELASLNYGKSGFHTPEVDDEGTETEEDPADEERSIELALKFPNKFSESLAVEVSPFQLNVCRLIAAVTEAILAVL
jgi:hypothetical protein